MRLREHVHYIFAYLKTFVALNRVAISPRSGVFHMGKPTGTSHIHRGRPTAVLLLAILVPIAAFVAVISVVIIGEARAGAERSAMESARAIIARVDAEVASNSKALAAIAQSIRGVPITRPWGAKRFSSWRAACRQVSCFGEVPP